MSTYSPLTKIQAERNWRRFVFFRVLYNSRFYYPVLAVLFIDLGLSAMDYTLLNFAWALAIVFTDLPAGVLADRIGRKPLVVTATCLMVVEMLLLCVAPLNGGVLLFLCCLANRILSGISEGMANGADEALVFDSLSESENSDQWPKVLDQVMRWQGVGMVIAMLVGGAVYDPAFVNRATAFLGFGTSFTQGTTLRFPIYLNLTTACIALAMVLGLREPGLRTRKVAPLGDDAIEAELTAWHFLRSAGQWILQTPIALFIITASVFLDSVSRLFLTFSSSYFRLIDIPAAAFGLIGATMGFLGFAVSPLARRLVAANSILQNYGLLSLFIFVGLLGACFQLRYWGVLFIFPIAGGMMALGYFVSYYLNSLVDASHRATVLSFKGVALNLGYGFISLLFALALKSVQNGTSTTDAFAHALLYLPLWILGAVLICAVLFRRHAKLLTARV